MLESLHFSQIFDIDSSVPHNGRGHELPGASQLITVSILIQYYTISEFNIRVTVNTYMFAMLEFMQRLLRLSSGDVIDCRRRSI